MPSFKPKTNKKIVIDQKNITTLDSKHEEILQNLNDELQVWYQSNGKSNIYKFLLNTKDY